VDLEQPISFFPALLAYNAAAIIPEGTKTFTGNWREGCVGTGPFRIQRFETDRRLDLEANPDYWRHGYPKSDGLVFTFRVAPQQVLAGFQSGKFALASNLFPADVDHLRHEPEFASRYREIPQLSTYHLVFNVHHGALSDENVRHQVVQAIDVEGLVRRTIGRLALPAHGLIPPGLLGYDPAARPPVRSVNRSVKKLKLKCMLNSIYDGPYAPLSREIFKALEEKGFHVEIIGRMDYGQKYTQENTKDWDLALTRWIADYPDADTFIHGMLHSQEGFEGALCGTPEMDQLIEKGRSETDPQRRHDIYREAEQMIADRALLLPLFHEQTYRFARPEVEDFSLNFSTLQPVPYEKLWIRR
jgi:ABC-type transport system substrate-binding protein